VAIIVGPGLKYDGFAVATIANSDYSLGFFRCDNEKAYSHKYCELAAQKYDRRRVFLVAKFKNGKEDKDCTFYIIKEYNKKAMNMMMHEAE